MAKSARASSKKVNHTKLRARVFGPVEKARAERIHAKLLETIAQPKPSEQKAEMDTTADSTTTEAPKEEDLSKDMDVDGAARSSSEKSSRMNAKAKALARKESRRKPKNSMSFPKSKGKGALKPFSGSKVNKRR